MSPANIAAVAQIYVGPFANINVNGPGGSTVECNPNFVPLQASPLNLGLCGHALTALAHDDPAGFELHTLFPVHTLNASTINGDTNDVFGIYADSNTTDELLSSSVDWGDGTSFTLTPSLDLEYTMEANHVYSHSFAQAGTYRVQCVFMLTDAVEIHEWDVVVTTASAGDPVSVLRRKLAIAPYPPAASTPWNPAASAPASVQIQ
jgi:hypothetical protein